ncbi:MAG: hypothetical protein WCP66_11215, partial [Methylococcales bacterium]
SVVVGTTVSQSATSGIAGMSNNFGAVGSSIVPPPPQPIVAAAAATGGGNGTSTVNANGSSGSSVSNPLKAKTSKECTK